MAVGCKNGSQTFIADTLSRAYLGETSPDVHVYNAEYDVLTVQPVASHKLDQLREETALDPVMNSLASTILHGWPENQTDVHLDIIIKPHFIISSSAVKGIEHFLRISNSILIYIYIYIYIYIVRQNDKLELLHLNFNHYRTVSYGKRSLPHSSGDYRV